MTTFLTDAKIIDADSFDGGRRMNVQTKTGKALRIVANKNGFHFFAPTLEVRIQNNTCDDLLPVMEPILQISWVPAPGEKLPYEFLPDGNEAIHVIERFLDLSPTLPGNIAIVVALSDLSEALGAKITLRSAFGVVPVACYLPEFPGAHRNRLTDMIEANLAWVEPMVGSRHDKNLSSITPTQFGFGPISNNRNWSDAGENSQERSFHDQVAFIQQKTERFLGLMPKVDRDNFFEAVDECIALTRLNRTDRN